MSCEPPQVVDLTTGDDESHAPYVIPSAFVERLSTRQMYANPWMVVREDQIRRADGSDGIFGVVDKPDYALVIPLDGDRLHLMEQSRYPLGMRRWEFPQGTAPDRAEVDPLTLARRELAEETGLRAESMIQLGLMDTAPGMSSQRGQVFLATGLTQGEPRREHTEQDMRTAWFARDELVAMIRDGRITDSQTIAAYGLLMLHELT